MPQVRIIAKNFMDMVAALPAMKLDKLYNNAFICEAILRRVFCKKGCDTDGETWEECLEECNEICYKDPVLKDQQWSACIDRSPGVERYSEECFHACVSGCGYKFDKPPDIADKVRPNRPPKPPPVPKPASPIVESKATAEDILGTSA